MPNDLAQTLAELGIEEIDADIFTMTKTGLHRRFSFATTPAINTTRLIKNLIWQDHRKLNRAELLPFRGNLRSYWYARLKPVLARAGVRRYARKYAAMIGQFVTLAMHRRIVRYEDFGFTDEGAHARSLGRANTRVLAVAEKVGHLPLLQELQRAYGVTIIAFGGQPSALSTEYLLRELEHAGNFVHQLRALGFAGPVNRIDLANPNRMTEPQIRLNKYPLSRRKSERKKNHRWAARTRGLTAYGHGALYGLEADAMTWAQLTEAFDQAVTDHLEVPRDQVIRRGLERELVEVLRDLLLLRLLPP
jgi:hypothetical protein